MTKRFNAVFLPTTSRRSPIGRGAWIVLGSVAALFLFVGTQNLIVGHADAIRLSLIPHPPSTEYSGQAHGMSDVLVVLVGTVTVVSLFASSYWFFHGSTRPGTGALILALVGACVLCFDANLVGTSGWLASCGSCGGEPQVAQEEARRAFGLTGAVAVYDVMALTWLRLREDYLI